MGDSRREQFVEDLLDRALARHRVPEPRPGLEERVLARLRAEPLPRPWFGWTGRLAAGVAVLALVVATAPWGRRRTVLAPATDRNLSTLSAPSTTPASPSQPEGTKRVRSQAAPTSPRTRLIARKGETVEPRREVFPSPAPLSEQERLLIAYLKMDPSAEPLGFPSGDDGIEGIKIKPLEIQPLETGLARSEDMTN